MFIIKRLLYLTKTKGLSRPSVFSLKNPLLLVICGFLWRIPQPLKHTFLTFLLIIIPISFFPFSHLFLTCDIGVVGFAINLVKFLHILIIVSFDDTRQTNFQKVYFLVFTVNPTLQFPFFRQFRKSFQTVTFQLQLIAFPFCVKDNPVLAVQFLINLQQFWICGGFSGHDRLWRYLRCFLFCYLCL